MFFLLDLFCKRRTKIVWHPNSPGMKIQVKRTCFEDFFKPANFATISEVLKRYDEFGK